MSLIKTTVTTTIRDQSLNPVPRAIVTAQLTRPEVDNGYVVPRIERFMADDAGALVMQLWPNTRGSGKSRYRLRVTGPNGRIILLLTIFVPEGAPVLVEEIVIGDTLPEVSEAEQLVISAQQEAIRARLWATSAEVVEDGLDSARTYALRAGDDAQQASQLRDEAESLRDQSEQHRQGAEDAQQAAQQAEQGAQQAQQSAEDALGQLSDELEQAQAARQGAEAAQQGAEAAEMGAIDGAQEAKNWAQHPVDEVVPEGGPGDYSAMHHATKAGEHAAAAQGSAGDSESSAAFSDQRANFSDQRATDAANSAALAEGHADAAEIARAAAELSQAGAESAKDAAQLIFQQFGDQYLGPHPSQPTVDNSGNPLTTGDVYFDTTLEVIKFYSGTAWVSPEKIASAAAQDALDSADNAAASEAAAANYAGASEQSAQASSASESKAQEWADKDEDLEVEPGKFSARHHAIKAVSDAGAANQSAGVATTQASLAAAARNQAEIERIRVEDEIFESEAGLLFLYTASTLNEVKGVHPLRRATVISTGGQMVRTFYLTADGSPTGEPLFANLATEASIQVSAELDNANNNNAPWAHILRVENNRAVVIGVRRSNQDSIVLGGTTSGSQPTDQAVVVRVRVEGERYSNE